MEKQGCVHNFVGTCAAAVTQSHCSTLSGLEQQQKLKIVV
jgi:hypothetical protein